MGKGNPVGGGIKIDKSGGNGYRLHPKTRDELDPGNDEMLRRENL